MLRKLISWVRDDPAILFILILVIVNFMSWKSLRDIQLVNYHLVSSVAQANQDTLMYKTYLENAEDRLDDCQVSMRESSLTIRDCLDQLRYSMPGDPTTPQTYEEEPLPWCDEVNGLPAAPVPI